MQRRRPILHRQQINKPSRDLGEVPEFRRPDRSLLFRDPFGFDRFTATEFTDVVLARGCKLSMDGRGAWRDNVFVERLWRSVKYERVYLKAYDGVSAARADIADYLQWYNTDRAHSSLDDVTPEQAYFNLLPQLAKAA